MTTTTTPAISTISDSPVAPPQSTEQSITDTYFIFSEQFLEKPYPPDIRMGPTLTLCTILNKSVPDDPDWDDR